MRTLTVVSKLENLRWGAGKTWLRLRRGSRTRDMSTLSDFYEDLWRNAAQELSASWSEVGPTFWRIDRGERFTLINNYVVQFDDPVTLNLAGDKVLCHEILGRLGLPVPAYKTYSLANFETALSFMAQNPGTSFVVKPATGTSGARGVTTHIMTARQCRRASALASLFGKRLLIERWIPGESYRLLFLDGEMIHASRRRGCRVVGDGTKTVAALITNQMHLDLSRLSQEILTDITATLAAQRLDLSAVLSKGDSVLVQSTPQGVVNTVEARTDFNEHATAHIGSALREQATRAVRAIGSRFAGVDIITTDPRVPLEMAGGVINEINTTPGLHHHYGLDRGHEGAHPAVRVLRRLLEINEEAERKCR